MGASGDSSARHTLPSYPSEYIAAMLLGGLAGFIAGLTLGTTVQWIVSFIPNCRVRGGPQWAGQGSILGAAILMLWRYLR